MNPEPAESPPSVFLVEDDANDVFFFERAARRSGFGVSIHAVPDGLEAMQRLQAALEAGAAPPPFRLVVLDLNLPSRSGLEVLEWIRSRPELDALPVVILTSSLSHEDVEAARRFGANAYHIKPPEPRQLVELVKRIFGEWLAPGAPREESFPTPPSSRA